ncbi:uncharacterized protein EV422DRAFT_264509 [Fimicolochytrium jonesii]|uniref:uncharacterized protein n=1 Tax=Fimicolochytrium jonesii TaxID=1396493 RepID=UPI0022FE2C8C|nr:uncharacterized protein EV422DRAFT_264509 [Fimicolochytrium jonesii]KAI8817097.1 hypothetical protein EV422DRAFT_264509 [Fimicolochytrium jonesii]
MSISTSNTEYVGEDRIRNRLRPRRDRVQSMKEVEVHLDLDLEEGDFEYDYEDGNDDDDNDSDYEGGGGNRHRGNVKEKQKTSKHRKILWGPALPEMEASVLFSHSMREYLCNEVVRAIENNVWIFDHLSLSELAAKPKNADCTNLSIEDVDDIKSGRVPSIGVDKDGKALFMFLPGIIGQGWQLGFVKVAKKVVKN